YGHVTGVQTCALPILGGAAAVDTREAPFQWLTLISVVVATWIMLRRVEKMPWSTVGLDHAAAAPPLILKGAAYGAITIGVASMLLLATQMLRIDRTIPGSWWGEAGH